MASLPTAVLGRTGLEVTRLGYGAMELRSDEGDRAVSDQHSAKVLNAVLDAGINFIDTAVCYGVSEERIGKAISHRRDEYFIATKCGCPATPAALEAGGNDYGHENMEAGVDQSLRRMKTDHLDVLQFHGTPAKSVLEEHDAIETLQRLRDKGKIRFIASSSSIPNIRDHIEMGVFDAFQIPYSALSRSHEGVIAQSASAGIGTIIRGGVAKGEPGVSGVSREESWKTFDDACLGELLEPGESKTAFILAVVTGNGIAAIPGMIITLLVGSWYFGFPLAFNPLIFAVVPLSAISLAGVGAAIGLGIPNWRVAGLVAQATMFFIMFFAPVMIPFDRLPAILQYTGMVLPPTYAAQAFRAALQPEITATLLRDLAILAVFGLGSLAIVARSLKWRLE